MLQCDFFWMGSIYNIKSYKNSLVIIGPTNISNGLYGLYVN